MKPKYTGYRLHCKQEYTRVICDRYLADEGVCAETTGKNCEVRNRGANLIYVYRGREDGGIQQVNQVTVPRT